VSKININTASREMLACLLPEGLNENCREKFVIAMANQAEDKVTFSQNGNIKKSLEELACYHSGKDVGDSREDKSTWFTQVSKVFRIEVEGVVGEQSQKLLVIIERLDSKEMKKRKTKQSYEVLYWKLI
jgi:hypothetical protein